MNSRTPRKPPDLEADTAKIRASLEKNDLLALVLLEAARATLRKSVALEKALTFHKRRAVV